MNSPTITVIMPAYNHERFVGAAIQSVLNQTCADFRLLVIDDGSTDDTGAVVKTFADPRIEYLWQENRDAFNTLNRGLRCTESPFVAILNSDDVYHPDRLRRLLAAQHDTGAQCLFTQIEPISEQGEVFTDPNFFWHVWHSRNRAYYFDCGDLVAAFLRGNLMVTTSNLFMTRAAMRQTGEFAALRYLHDYDYILRLLLNLPDQTVYLHEEVLLQYRLHGSNTLSEAAIVGREQDQAVIREYTLAQCPNAVVRKRVETGLDRLLELEHELSDARAELERQRCLPAGELPPIPISFAGRLRRRLRRR